MADRLFWAARCKNCSEMVGYRDVRYTLDVYGANVEEKLPEGTTRRRCDHCGTVGEFELRHLRPTPASSFFRECRRSSQPRCSYFLIRITPTAVSRRSRSGSFKRAFSA